MNNSQSIIRKTLNVFKEKTAMVIIFIAIYILTDALLSDLFVKIVLSPDSILGYNDGMLAKSLKTILLMLNLSIFLTIIAKNCTIGEATLSILKSIIPILMVSFILHFLIAVAVQIVIISGCIGMIGMIASTFILVALCTRLLFVFHITVLEKEYFNAIKISMLYVQGHALMIFYKFMTAVIFFALLTLLIFLPIIILYAVIFAHVQLEVFALLGFLSAPLFLGLIKCTWAFIIALIVYFIYQIYREKLLQSWAEEDLEEQNR